MASHKHTIGPHEYLFDEEDWERLSKMGLTYHNRQGYLMFTYKWRKITGHNYVHRYLMSAPKGMSVDHTNGNVYDNRKANLRLCTFAENSRNKSRSLSHNTLGVKGVRKHQKYGFDARVICNGKNHYAGHAKTIEDAARLYDKKAKELFGEFAKLNYAE